MGEKQRQRKHRVIRPGNVAQASKVCKMLWDTRR